MDRYRVVILYIVLLFLASIAPAHSVQAAMRVLVLPFDVYGAGDISSLRREVLNTVAFRFEEEGAEVVGIDEIKRLMVDDGVISFSEERAVALSKKVAADFALLGSITRFDGAISIDWRLYDLAQKRNVALFFRKGSDRRTILKEMEGLVATTYSRAVEFMAEVPVERDGVIAGIAIRGNRRVDSLAIMRAVSAEVGDTFSPEGIGEDIKALFSMGYFEDVQAELVDSVSGKMLAFAVRERPYIKEIVVTGNKKLSQEKVEGVITAKENTILNRTLLQEDVEAIRALYEGDGYYLAKAAYDVTIEESAAVVTFSIKENEKVKVRRVTIIGNKKMSDQKIKKRMETKEAGFFSFLTGSGKFNEFLFARDLDMVLDLYFNSGYIQAEVVDHRALLSEDKRWFYVTIAVSEGEQFSVGSIDITGEMVVPEEELMKEVKLIPGVVFNRKLMREGMERFREIYGDKGYAKVDINPATSLDHDSKVVNITFDIRKGPLVYIEQIDIDGNTRTRDKVIRRELEVEEEQLYSLTGIKRSRNKLRRLGYFDEVTISERPGSLEDRLSLNIRVKERPTGQISAGFGYSSIDKFIGTVSISQNNLAGTGVKLNFSATFGGSTEQYQVGLTEPWLFDRPLSAGFDIFKNTRDFTDFTEKSTGFDLRFGFPLYFKDTRGSLVYKNEEVEISDVANTASLLIKDQEGKSDIRSINALVKRDSRNDAFFPTEGSTASISVEYAGGPLGGDNNFIKYIVRGKKYFPMPWKSAIALRGEAGAVHGFDGTATPISERFFLGGINSMRGFESRSIGPQDPATAEVVGGDKEALASIEFLFPLIEAQRLTGVLFFDIGNAYNTQIVFDEVRKSAGLGVRWFSPMGPIRLEYGFNLDRRDGEQHGRFEFSLGTPF
ncbi:MAG: outer membrane protein assembly factor BamA [Deltaproteobacteria bacterium]|nr:outer membrane protein assembly factor BamA [Deltaproteobacteria bacterium]